MNSAPAPPSYQGRKVLKGLSQRNPPPTLAKKQFSFVDNKIEESNSLPQDHTERISKIGIQHIATLPLKNESLEKLNLSKKIPWFEYDGFWNRFEQKEKLGSGSYGDVYRFYDTERKKGVAVKVLKDVTNASLYEILILQLLASDKAGCGKYFVCYRGNYIIPWPEPSSSQTKGEKRHVVIMDFLQGTTLNQFINKQNGPLKTKELRALFTSAVESLAKLHGKGIAHRDIKPENLFVTDKGNVALIDVGVSCLRDEEPSCRTKADEVVGTPCLSMSPDQFVSFTGSPKQAFAADVYALAYAFFPLFTGESNLRFCGDVRKVALYHLIGGDLAKDVEVYFGFVDEDPKLVQVYLEMLNPTLKDRPTAAEAFSRLFSSVPSS